MGNNNCEFLKSIFNRSQKAELIDAIVENDLEDAYRILVCIEKRYPNRQESDYQYYQLGFDQLYEIQGFIGCIDDIITYCDQRTDNDDESESD